MTVKEFEEKQKEQLNLFIFNEVQERSQAAARLSEKFDIDGITIYGGCDEKGRVKVVNARRLAEICATELKTRKETYNNGSIAEYEYFIIDGVEFSELVKFYREGDKNGTV